MGLREQTMITKMNKAMIILYKEQQRRAKLPIRNKAYINEIAFMRKFLRRLYRKLSATKIKNGKYPVLLSESQWQEISENFRNCYMSEEQALSDENYANLENQIKVAKGQYQ